MRPPRSSAALLTAAAVWLPLLAFPVLAAAGGTTSNGALVAGVVGVALLVAAYLRTMILAAVHGAPRPALAALAVATAVAVALPLVAGPVWFGATVFLAALCGVSLGTRAALVGVAAVTALAGAQAWAGAGEAGQAIAVPLLTLMAGGVMIAVVGQVRLADELARSRRAFAEAAAQNERLRLARELHDSVKQQAFVAALELGSARARLGPDPHLEAAAEAVATVQRQLGEVIEHLRPVEQEPLGPALRRHVERWTRRTGVAVDLHADCADAVPAEPLLSVVTEALTNVARHAGARRVRLSVQVENGNARLTVDDDGCGFDPVATPRGQGLRGMAERLAAQRGELHVRSGTAGTVITAAHPVQK